ncbi:MAG: PaaI family thioesterase [Defluviicoccus sp.]|nr:PaaI family thioesterase [Defluviicoccus sp.]
MTVVDDLDEFARTVFEGQKFSAHLEAKLGPVSAGKAEISIELKEFHKQQHGFAHGGVVSYLADNSIAYAGGLAMGGNALVSEYKINYVRPGVGKTLVARAEAIAVGRSQAVCQSRVYGVAEDGTEKLCAIAQGTVVPAPDP